VLKGVEIMRHASAHHMHVRISIDRLYDRALDRMGKRDLNARGY
jgi:hypothetical protein